MRVSCYCGMIWDSTEGFDACPLCGEPASLPSVALTKDQEAMFVELQTLLDEHGTTED